MGVLNAVGIVLIINKGVLLEHDFKFYLGLYYAAVPYMLTTLYWSIKVIIQGIPTLTITDSQIRCATVFKDVVYELQHIKSVYIKKQFIKNVIYLIYLKNGQVKEIQFFYQTRDRIKQLEVVDEIKR